MKESEMFRANKILEKNKKKYEGYEKLKEKKLEQLRKIFHSILINYDLYTIDEIVAQLVYEVKIRINNK